MTSIVDITTGLLDVATVLVESDAAREKTEHSARVAPPFSTTTQVEWADGVRLWNLHGAARIKTLAERNCPACGNPEHRHLFQTYDGYPYVECLKCGTWHVPLQVTEEIFDEFYANVPEAKEVLLRTLLLRESETSHLASLERIGAYMDVLSSPMGGLNGKRYLDMGCGLGQSLQAAKKRNMNALGVEASRECIARVKSAGYEIRHVSDRLDEDAFDLISFWESLEHMVDPLGALQQCKKWLAPNGVLALTVPNLNSTLVRAQRADCSFVNGGFDTPGHINLFNAKTLEVLLARADYVVLAMDGQYGLNLGELMSYMQGRNRGAFDLLSGMSMHTGLSESSEVILNGIGPAVTLIERLTLMSPILFCFACRAEDADHFSKRMAEFKEARMHQILQEIKTLRMRPSTEELRAQLEQARDDLDKLKQAQSDLENPWTLLQHFFRRVFKTQKG